MARESKKGGKPWQLKFTWGLSLVMLLLIFGFFYQSWIEVREMAPVKVVVERLGEP